MKAGDLSVSWRSRLNESGPAEAVRAIRNFLVSASSEARPEISRALELLFATLPLDQARSLADAINEDARTLRHSHGKGPLENMRITALQRRKKELEARLAELRQGRPEDAELQRQIEALSHDEKCLLEAISQLSNEFSQLTTQLQRLNGS